MNQAVSDLFIVNQVLAGKISSFDQLVVRHKDYAYTIAYKILNNDMDAEEVAHDAFIKAFKALKSFNQQAKFTTWFYRIVFNTAISRKRKESKPLTDIDVAKEIASDDLPPGSRLEQTDLTEFINKALANMMPVDAAIISMFYMKQLNLQEIGEIIGVKTSSVKVKLFRARKKLGLELTALLNEETYHLL